MTPIKECLIIGPDLIISARGMPAAKMARAFFIPEAPMSRTPEQVNADDALTAAIEQCMRAYHEDDRPFVLTEYMVLTSRQGFDDDGEGLTAVGALYRDGDVPTHRALGLIECVGARLRKVITKD